MGDSTLGSLRKRRGSLEKPKHNAFEVLPSPERKRVKHSQQKIHKLTPFKKMSVEPTPKQFRASRVSAHSDSEATPKAARPKPKRVFTPLQDKQLEAEDLLKELESSTAYEKIIAEKDAAYAVLLEKYNKLKAVYEKSQSQAFAEFNAATEEKEKKATAAIQSFKAENEKQQTMLKSQITEIEELKKQQATIKAEGAKAQRQVADLTTANATLQTELQREQEKSSRELEQLQKQHTKATAELTNLEHQVERLTTANAKLHSDFSRVERKALGLQTELEQERGKLAVLMKVEETYRLLTATVISHVKKNLYTCKLVKQNPYRVVEFRLDAGPDNILFQPLQVKLGGSKYPGWMASRIQFVPLMAPIFMRDLLQNVYAPTPSNPQIFTPMKLP